jgi:ferredoxin
LPAQANLSEHLNIQNSPVLFGCRTGICGTCLCEVRVLQGAIEPPSEDEVELIGMLAPEIPGARLACQIQGSAHIELKYYGSKT